MILDPVNSVANVDFYKKISGQSVGRSFLYICYLGGLFAFACTIAVKIYVGPAVDETFKWLESSVPPLTLSAGKVTSTQTEPVKLQHPTIPEVAMVIDTLRVDPVTPQLMEEQKVMGYLTSNAFYLRDQRGKVEIHDLSKWPAEAKPVQIDAPFFRSASIVMSRVLYPAALIVTFFVFLAWKGTATMLYSLAALAANSISHASLSYPALLNIAVYAQTLAIGVQTLALFLPFRLPMLPISLGLTGIYIWLAVKRHTASSLPSVSA
jgi:hypothetical protein